MKTKSTSSIVLFGLTAFMSLSVLAQQKAQSAKTVGDLLKQADRGADLKSSEKSQTLIPSSNDSIVDKRKAESIDLTKVKPPRTSTMISEGDDDKAKLEKITDKQIADLFGLTQKFKSSPRRGELWLRLAELYVEKASLIDFRKQSAYDSGLREFQSGKTKNKPTLQLAEAREYNKKAIQLYDWFVRDFPKDEKIDQALYFLGYNNYEIGNVKKGTEYYTRLIKEFPRSPYVVESNFALGEFYFENEKWTQALSHYENVVRYRRHRLYGFSVFKTAWCYFRSGDTPKAQKILERLILDSREESKQAGGKKALSKLRMEQEAVRDLVVFYADVGDAFKAPSYFQEFAGKDAPTYVEKLAYYYADKGNREAAKANFNFLIQANPTSPKAFDYKHQIVQSFATATKTREFRDEMYSWIHDFGESSAWFKANGKNKELIENSNKLREATLKNWTLQQHQTAQNSKAKFSQTLADEGYKLYLQEFGNSPISGDMRFYYAELMYDMDRYDEAGVQYRWVVEKAPQSKFYAKAAENMILALEKTVPKDAEISKNVGSSNDPVTFSPKIDKFVEASIWYISKFPDSPKYAEIEFRIGRLYYQHNQFDKSIPYFKEIVKKHPKTKFAEYSANLLLDIFNIKKDYETLEKVGGELLAIPTIAGSQLGADIKNIIEKAQFKRAQESEGKKDFAKAAEQYELFGKTNSKSNLAIVANYNAALNFERGGLIAASIAAHQRVTESQDLSQPELQKKSRRILAKLLQESGHFEEAAQNYSRAADDAGQDPIAANLHFNAAVLFEALSKNNEAIVQYDSFYKKNSKADKVEVNYLIAQIYRRTGAKAKAIEYYKAYLLTAKDEKAVESAYWVHELSKSINRTKDAEEYKKKTLSLQKNSAGGLKGAGASYVAKIKFADASLAYAMMRNIQIPADPAKQQVAAQKKMSMMANLNQLLVEVVKHDSAEEIVGALSVLGQANLHMNEALMSAPLPQGLNAEETKQYKEAVQKIADPFLIKAKESLKLAVERGRELQVYHSDYNKALSLIAKLDPQNFKEPLEFAVPSQQGSWMGL